MQRRNSSKSSASSSKSDDNDSNHSNSSIRRAKSAFVRKFRRKSNGRSQSRGQIGHTSTFRVSTESAYHIARDSEFTDKQVVIHGLCDYQGCEVKEDKTSTTWLSVYSGFGVESPNFLSSRLHRCFVEQLKHMNSKNNFKNDKDKDKEDISNNNGEDNNLNDKDNDTNILIDSVFKKTFETANKELELQQEVENFSSYSEALCCWINDDTIYVANCGFNRALLIHPSRREWVDMNQLHVPSNFLEKERIVASGGRVINGTVNGRSRASRYLGGSHHLGIICEPEVVQARLAKDEVHVIVLATKGLSERIPSQKIANLVSDVVSQPPRRNSYHVCGIDASKLAYQIINLMEGVTQADACITIAVLEPLFVFESGEIDSFETLVGRKDSDVNVLLNNSHTQGHALTNSTVAQSQSHTQGHALTNSTVAQSQSQQCNKIETPEPGKTSPRRQSCQVNTGPSDPISITINPVVSPSKSLSLPVKLTKIKKNEIGN